MYRYISGGVCAPKGFRAAGIRAGIRPNKTKKDLALIVSDVPASAAAVYTQNLVQGAPIAVTREHLKDGRARAIICNSGIANTCDVNGVENARAMCRLCADALAISPEDVIVASTGVIGQPLPVAPVAENIGRLVEALSASEKGAADAEEAIMTTDTVPKIFAAETEIGGKTVRIGGCAKGSGMLNPNMATMLAFLTTDAEIAPRLLQRLLKDAADASFNRVSVDGDTSTNDTLAVLANGESGAEILENTPAEAAFAEALRAVCVSLAKALAKDGEGATKLAECRVSGAASRAEAERVADAVINSPLVKTALFGADTNWGRVLCAIGYAGVPLDVSKTGVSLRSAAGAITVCENGAGVAFSEAAALEILKRDEIIIDISLGRGRESGVAWGCDLSYDYVKINGDYRT
jgi:glutamate N-acetyltransferase/amino-acid N-acetyltransferase